MTRRRWDRYSGSPRANGTNPRANGTNPRANGTNPSAGTITDVLRVNRARARARVVLRAAGETWCHECDDSELIEVPELGGWARHECPQMPAALAERLAVYYRLTMDERHTPYLRRAVAYIVR